MFEEEAEERIKEKYSFQSFITREQGKELYQDGAEFGYNKANEWHYIKDEDFPTAEGEYWVYRSKSKYSVLAFDGSFWITGVQDDLYDNIIAWKEIVLPKESE